MKDNEILPQKSSIKGLDKRLSAVMDYLLRKNPVLYKTKTNVAEAIGFPRTNFSAALKGEEKYLTDNIVNKFVSKFPELNKEWLLTGEGEMLKDEGEKVSILKPNKDAPELTGYYYPNVSASAGLDISTLNQELEKVPIYLPSFGKDIDFINVYGDSMYPKYNAGEIIGIKLIEFQYLNYGYPYVIIFKNGDVYIKYVKKGKDENHILLESENTFYEPREFNINLIQNFYSIRGVIKKEMM